MSVIISDKVSSVSFLFSNGQETILDKDKLNIKKHGIIYEYVYITNGDGFTKTSDNEVVKIRYNEVTSPSLASNDELVTLLLGYKVSSGAIMGSVQITDGVNSMTLEPNGSLPVTLQDQGTPSIITNFSILEQATTTTGDIAIGDYIIPVASVTGIITGKYLSVFDPVGVRFTNFFVVSVASLNVTIDRPSDFAYPSGSYVDVQDTNLAVDGSSTPVIAGIRNNAGGTPPPGINLTMDVTRLMFYCIASSALDYTKFANLTALTNGLMCRKRDGEHNNIFNVKTNGEIAGIMFDFDISVASGSKGVDGFVGRITFAGQNKMGVTQRIAINEDIELILQDNLSTITRLEVIAEGSVVQP